MKRIPAILVAICLFAAPAHAQTRSLIAAGGWGGYGAQNPINGAASDFFGRYQVNFTGCFAIVALATPPWDPNGAGGLGYFLNANLNATGTCNTGALPNPAQGVYFRENAPHRAHDVVFWFRLNGNITTNTFILRLNDSTHGSSTGVYRGAIDYTAPFIDTANKLNSDLPSDTGKSAALVLGAWNIIEYCYVAGVNGSGTIPPKSKFWLNGTQFLTFGADTTISHGGGDTITFDAELGGGGGFDFGPWMDFDTGSDCPASALATPYYTFYQPIANSAVQFSVNTASTNYQAVNGTAGANGYVFDATAGQKDIYTTAVGSFGTILGVTNRLRIESDAPGQRIALPLYNNGSTTTVGSLGNGITLGGGALNLAPFPYSLVNGTYYAVDDTHGNSIFTGSAWVASELNKIGVALVQ